MSAQAKYFFKRKRHKGLCCFLQDIPVAGQRGSNNRELLSVTYLLQIGVPIVLIELYYLLRDQYNITLRHPQLPCVIERKPQNKESKKYLYLVVDNL